MDHPVSPYESVVRPWRTAAYVAGAIALVELVFLLILGGGALVESVSARVQVAARDHARQKTIETKPVANRRPERAAVAKTPRTKIAVIVLNGNGRTGAAATAAARVRGRGYKIRSVGNAKRTDFAHSLVMFRPGFAGEGRRLARDLGVKQVGPLDGMRVRDLRGAHAVYILGA